MSSSGHSKLIRGAKIEFEGFPTIVKLNRFDSITGEKKIIEQESFLIKAKCDKLTVELPPETESYKETKKHYHDLGSWKYDRMCDRITNWLHGHEIYDEDETEGVQLHMDHENMQCIIGFRIASGSSYSDRIVNVNEYKLLNVTDNNSKHVKDMLCKLFKQQHEFSIPLLLMTTCG